MTLKSQSLTRRAWSLVGVLFLVILGWLLFHRQINRSLTERLLLRSPSPREDAFEQLVAQLPDPSGFLERCWATGKIPHRQLVASYLRNQGSSNPSWFAGAEKLVLEGTGDPDMSVRELSLAT